jgi:hypothetical protein
MLPFDIEGALVCDDVREERTGKLILIGVYVRTINVADFPTDLRLTFWLQITVKEAGEHSGEMRIINSEGAVLLKGETVITLKRIGRTAIGLEEVSFQVQSESTITLQMRFSEADEWHSIRQINVAKRKPRVLAPATSVASESTT